MGFLPSPPLTSSFQLLTGGEAHPLWWEGKACRPRHGVGTNVSNGMAGGILPVVPEFQLTDKDAQNLNSENLGVPGTGACRGTQRPAPLTPPFPHPPFLHQPWREGAALV